MLGKARRLTARYPRRARVRARACARVCVSARATMKRAFDLSACLDGELVEVKAARTAEPEVVEEEEAEAEEAEEAEAEEEAKEAVTPQRRPRGRRPRAPARARVAVSC